MSKMGTPQGDVITILLVDDISETRENIKKLLAFEQDFKVIDTAANGREAVNKAKELKPRIVVMDINMPDMDGIQAAGEITKAVPTAAVIMMSVQNETDYIRRAMQAGARNFLTKPVDPDELYNTIRAVYEQHKPVVDSILSRERMIADMPVAAAVQTGSIGSENRPGHIVVVYSPQGGVGTTTIATNLASGLMREGIKVLLVDADLQFGDVGVFLNLQGQNTIVDAAANVTDLDTEFFENVVVTHPSGLKVLLGPPRPEFAVDVEANPTAVAEVLDKISGNYDFIIVDTATRIDDMSSALFERATRILLVATPTLSAVRNIRFVLDLFDKAGFANDKTMLVLNRMQTDRDKAKISIPTEAIERHLKRPVVAKIPLEERVVLSAVNKGVPVIASERDRTKQPIKELLELSETVYTTLMGDQEQEPVAEPQKPSVRNPFGGNRR